MTFLILKEHQHNKKKKVTPVLLLCQKDLLNNT